MGIFKEAIVVVVQNNHVVECHLCASDTAEKTFLEACSIYVPYWDLQEDKDVFAIVDGGVVTFKNGSVSLITP